MNGENRDLKSCGRGLVDWFTYLIYPNMLSTEVSSVEWIFLGLRRCAIDQLRLRISFAEINKQTNTVEVICPYWGVARPISAPPLILFPPTSFSLWQACAFLCAHTSLQLHSFCWCYFCHFPLLICTFSRSCIRDTCDHRARIFLLVLLWTILLSGRGLVYFPIHGW